MIVLYPLGTLVLTVVLLPELMETCPRLATCPMTTCGVEEDTEEDEIGEEEVREGATPRRDDGLGVGG